MYPGITLFHLTIPSYWVMALIGAILSFLFVHIRKRKFHIPGDDVTHIFLFCVVGGIIGAKLLHLLVALPNMLAHLDVMNTQPDLWTDYFLNGFVFYGGVIGGFLFALWYCKRYRIYFLEACDLFTPILPFFHIFGRIGCFLAGCCYGIPSSWGFIYPHETASRLPLPLIEAACNIMILMILLLFEKYCSPRGYHLPFYGILYRITRFVLEFFRGDSARGVWLLSDLPVDFHCSCFRFRHMDDLEYQTIRKVKTAIVACINF